MTTAIVTITCPHCGGDLKGIETTEQEQTVTCPYCKTELHVPHVGDEIVRERVVRERVVREVIVEKRGEPIEEPAAPAPAPPRPRPSMSKFGVFAFSFTVTLLVILMFLKACTSYFEPPTPPDAAELSPADCEVECTQSCANAQPATRGGDRIVDEWMHDSERISCKNDCKRERCPSASWTK